MFIKDSYESFQQRLAAYYCVSLAPFPEQLSDEDAEKSALEDLHSFFSHFYKLLYDHPENFYLQLLEDISLKPKEHHSKNKIFKKAEGAVKPLNMDFIDLLYEIGQKGLMDGVQLIGDARLYEKYLSKKKKDKQKFLEGLALLGLELSVNDDKLILRNAKYPQMFQAMSAFAQKCAENEHDVGRFCFLRCDLQALDIRYQPSAEALLDRLISNSVENEPLIELHRYMRNHNYAVICKPESDVQWIIQYTNKKIKSSPLVSISFDMRFQVPVTAIMKFVSTSRLAPIIGVMSDEMQESFFADTGRCRGEACGWCKNQKGLLRPSLIAVKEKQKTICWFSQKHYTIYNAIM